MSLINGTKLMLGLQFGPKMLQKVEMNLQWGGAKYTFSAFVLFDAFLRQLSNQQVHLSTYDDDGCDRNGKNIVG